MHICIRAIEEKDKSIEAFSFIVEVRFGEM